MKDGGRAFACAAENGHDPGMSLRDYFAAQALLGMITRGSAHTREQKTHMATSAYQYADAMISEHEKETT